MNRQVNDSRCEKLGDVHFSGFAVDSIFTRSNLSRGADFWILFTSDKRGKWKYIYAPVALYRLPSSFLPIFVRNYTRIRAQCGFQLDLSEFAIPPTSARLVKTDFPLQLELRISLHTLFIFLSAFLYLRKPTWDLGSFYTGRVNWISFFLGENMQIG